jgi:hypothetical protein
MALLVPNIGEVDSLRTLLNATHNIPRNLVLKLYTSNTVPAEGDVPSPTAYFEPYNASNTNGYGSTPSGVTGYPSIVNNRNDQDYTGNFGILLNGSRWQISTVGDPVASATATGVAGEYTINVTSITYATGATAISVGNLVTASGITAGTKVARVSGSTIVLDTANAQTVNGAITFNGGVTTASYPEQTFTFTGAAGNVYGYYLARANNLPLSVHGVVDAATVTNNSGSPLVKGDNTYPCSGTVGNNFIVIPATVSGQTVTGLDDITVGMSVAGNNGVAANTKVIGIDLAARRVFLDKNLVDNIQVATDSSVEFTFSTISTGATSHNLQVGDVLYVEQGTGGSTVTAGTYTVFSKTNTTFTTTPALAGTGNATLRSSILFAERFTNGPYPIQNNGDQIKISLNVSLD